MSKVEEDKLKEYGVDRIIPICCGREFLWMKPSANSYGKDMPVYCPWCGFSRPAMRVG